MPDLTRAEIDEFWQSWLDANREAERSGDWRPLAEFYAEDASVRVDVRPRRALHGRRP